LANSYSLANLHSFADLNSFNVALARRCVSAHQFALANQHGSATRPSPQCDLHRRDAVTFNARRLRSVVTLPSRSNLGAILPLHDVRYHATRTNDAHPIGRRDITADAEDFLSANEHPGWWSQTGSNRRPPACKAGALPTELWPRTKRRHASAYPMRKMVGLGRLELPTSRLSSARSNQLSYKPVPEIGDQRSVIRKRRTFLIADF
jgi:hypothetical protein